MGRRVRWLLRLEKRMIRVGRKSLKLEERITLGAKGKPSPGKDARRADSRG